MPLQYPSESNAAQTSSCRTLDIPYSGIVWTDKDLLRYQNNQPVKKRKERAEQSRRLSKTACPRKFC
jgi:hypothetical protein